MCDLAAHVGEVSPAVAARVAGLHLDGVVALRAVLAHAAVRVEAEAVPGPGRGEEEAGHQQPAVHGEDQSVIRNFTEVLTLLFAEMRLCMKSSVNMYEIRIRNVPLIYLPEHENGRLYLYLSFIIYGLDTGCTGA